MPGKFPGKVVLVKNINSVVNDVPVEAAAYLMLQQIDARTYRTEESEESLENVCKTR